MTPQIIRMMKMTQLMSIVVILFSRHWGQYIRSPMMYFKTLRL